MENNEQIKEVEDGGASCTEAAREVAAALRVIDKYSDFIPRETYQAIWREVHEWIGEADWENKPRLTKVILPLLLREVMLKT